jgi:DNA polymerase
VILWLDRETYCHLDLKVVGTYRYADMARDLLFAYAIDDGPAHVWDVASGAQIPDDLEHALREADEVWAHNAQFDKAIHAAPMQAALPPVAPDRWRCSMAMALSHALPASLADLCEVLKVPADMAKDKEGKKLIALFCKPQPAKRKVQHPDRDTHPEEWARFVAYADRDIVAMRECVRRIPRWNWDKSAIAEWHCDQRINTRGFQVDQELTRAGAAAAVTEKERIAVRFAEITNGLTPGQRDKVKAFVLQRFNVHLDDTTRDTFEQLLKRPRVDPTFAELMQLSIASNKTSTAKYAALDPAVQADGRFRGGLQFAGASRTRRFAGRLFQPQNLPSRGLPDADDVERYIECLKVGVHDLFFDNLMLYGAAALRGIVIPSPGKKLVVADLSNIEGRVLSWLAGEHWKLQAFREYDAGTGPDLYNVTAVSIIGGDPWKVAKKDRNVFGKVPDLASGYQGGVAGYQTFARAYGVRMADYWDTIQQQIAAPLIQKARDNLETFGRPQLESLEISETEWVASEACKLAWRARHPATTTLWYGLQRAAQDAIRHPGTTHSVGQYLKLKRVKHEGFDWLVIRLPSGRYLTYFEPHLVRGADGRYTIAYFGESAEEGKTTRQWVRVFTHGGKMTGNCCQTVARDILMPALLVAEKRGYTPVLSVHDEAITEVPNTPAFSAQGLTEILAANSKWNEGLPLSAAAFECTRYRKE